MAKMLHKMAAAVLTGCMLLGTASVWAAPVTDRAAAKMETRAAKQQEKAAKKLARQQAKQQKKIEKQRAKQQRLLAKAEKERKVTADTILYAEIVGYEQGNIYLLDEGNGRTLRADLGKNGGRLWRLTPMKFSGTFVQDDKGRLFKMVRVDYKDPKDGDRKLQSRKRMSTSTQSQNGDAALYHASQVPTDNSNYITQNLAGVSDLSVYQKMSVVEMNRSAVGTKVSLVGRPIETVQKDKVMKFMDRGNHPFYVLMNGGFIPLGQRSLLYGAVGRDNDGVTYLSLEQIDSVQ